MGGVPSVWWAHGHTTFYIYLCFSQSQTARGFDGQWGPMWGSLQVEPMSESPSVAPQASRGAWRTAHVDTTSSTGRESVRLPILGIIHLDASPSVFQRAGSKESEHATAGHT